MRKFIGHELSISGSRSGHSAWSAGAMMHNLARAALPILLWGGGVTQALSADVEAAQSATAMVGDPCPPPISLPQALTNARDGALIPGKSAANFSELFAKPEMQAYMKAEQDRARSDWPDLCRYRRANAALKKPPRVVFIGDSITESWVAGDPDLFSDDVIGRGISGQTSPQILLRFFQDVIELRPQIVHIMAGTNDIAGNTGRTTEQDFKNNISAMVDLARAHHIQVALASILPASGFSWKPGLMPASTIVRLNGWLRDFALKSHVRYIDYHSALAEPRGGFIPELSNDGVHPNRNGYAVMRKLALVGIAK
jgi:lysophospholipase L1-like esterase